MIIKVERYKDQRYWMFDSVRKFSLSKPIYRKSGFDSMDQQRNAPSAWDAMIFDFDGCNCRDNGKDPEKNCENCVIFYVLICRLSDGTEYTIAFDTMVYVMNDQGRTIEKIVANYNTQTENIK